MNAKTLLLKLLKALWTTVTSLICIGLGFQYNERLNGYGVVLSVALIVLTVIIETYAQVLYRDKFGKQSREST